MLVGTALGQRQLQRVILSVVSRKRSAVTSFARLQQPCYAVPVACLATIGYSQTLATAMAGLTL